MEETEEAAEKENESPAPVTKGETFDSAHVALSEIGFTENEVAVLLTTLALGSRPASTIAEKANLKRTHTYNILSSLMERGVVQEFVKNGVRHFTCSSPESLLTLFEYREKALARRREAFKELIPYLQSLKSPLAAPPKVRFYNGRSGVKEIFEDMLRTGENIYGIFDYLYTWSVMDADDNAFINDFIRRRQEKEIWYYGIIARSKVGDKAPKLRPSTAYKKRKMLEGFSLPAEVNIYGSKVAITVTHQEVMGVVIDNKFVADTLRSIHQALWQFLPDYSFNEPAPGASI